ncbi:MAG: FKBP-type peptidyl-prolyl cis-trans isomerase [Bacteroidales bacterium]|nr:FKBP-type peptidyl-prolyl cis-trans isomerase [Candidatus Sodaliphilus fimicaballi]
MAKIADKQYVELAYEIFVVEDGKETSIFKFTKEQPDAFVFGLDPGMLVAFKAGIEGLEQGDKFDFTLAPADAFGESDPNLVMDLPRDTFLVDGEFDTEKVYLGAMVPMMTADGMRVMGQVVKMEGDVVTLDFNHQLAGETIKYVGEVLTVRDASLEELNPRKGGCAGSCGGSCGDCGGGCGDCGGGCN